VTTRPRLRAALYVAAVAVPTLLACGQTRDAPQPGADARTAAVTRLDTSNVPGDLRHLVPLAERWGIGDDVERNAAVDRATPAERTELERAVTPVHARITAWLDSFGQQPMPDEAAAFMYMQLALEEMRAGPR
jgi:hypothetical protein